MVKLYGFAIIRNGVKYDYPFVESLKCLNNLCEEVYVAAGDSEDNTNEVLNDLGFLNIENTVWDPALLKAGGVILSQQTNLILNKLRKDKKDVKHAWGLYLQCDEVLHQRQFKKLLTDIWHAEEHGYDAISLRYFHFWQSHNKIAINKKWYPEEIRVVKLDSKVESWGDAQSFRNCENVYQSDVTVYHYGHIRDEEKYKVKKKEFLELYHTEDKIDKYRKREKRFDDQTEVLDFFGPQPAIMKERIEKLGGVFTAPAKEDIYIIGDRNDYEPELINMINVKHVHFVSAKNKVPEGTDNDLVINMQPNFFERLFSKDEIPGQMRSKLARPWGPNTRLLLKLSKKKIGFKG